MYIKSEVEKVALDYFKGDNIVANVWMDKYALKQGDNLFLEISPEDTIKRMASELYRIENKYPNPLSYDVIYNLMTGYNKFILAGSPLFGVGNDLSLSTLGNCFLVDSPRDSYGGICYTDQELAQLMKRRGGVGVDISTIRPKNTSVNNAAKYSTGIIPFMERFSNTTKEVAQDGRRGALMITININHPDIEAYITSKDDLSKITGANISIKITDDFMNAVKNDEIYRLNFENKVELEISALRLWNKIIHQAWKSAEPGILFWDKIIEQSPADCYEEFKTIGTNPCSEIPLCPYDSCRLGHINLYSYVLNPFTINAGFDLQTLSTDVINCQRLMDDLIELDEEKINTIINKIKNDPESQNIKQIELDLWTKILNKLKLGRRTGLGQMGLADTMAALGLPYAKDASLHLAFEIARTIALHSYISSIQLAEERGHFPLWNSINEENNIFIQKILKELPVDYLEKYYLVGRRNIANLTIAPTGTTSMLAGVSSGMEPIFDLKYTRRRKVTEDNPNKKYQDKQGIWWDEYDIFHSKFKDFISIKSKASVFPNEMSDVDFKAWSEESPYYKSTAYDVKVEDKLVLQSILQPWIDHSISVTYNLPKEAKEEDVHNLYMRAWELGLKGLTVYRDSSREGILNTTKIIEFPLTNALKRPKVLPHDIYSVMSKGHHWIVSIGLLDGRPYEVFAFNNVNISGSKFTGDMIRVSQGKYNLNIKDIILIEDVTKDCSDEENLLTRMISTALRHGADIKYVVDQLYKSEGDITSFGKAIGRILKKYVKDGYTKNNNMCPSCNLAMEHVGGCWICKNCGSSKCD